MLGFKLYSKTGKELDGEGFPVVRTEDGRRRTGEPPEAAAYFDFPCPKRRDSPCRMLRIKGGPADDGTMDSWQWDGNPVEPTMKPSINCFSHNPANPNERYAGCGWHGWITEGATKAA